MSAGDAGTTDARESVYWFRMLKKRRLRSDNGSKYSNMKASVIAWTSHVSFGGICRVQV